MVWQEIGTPADLIVITIIHKGYKNESRRNNTTGHLLRSGYDVVFRVYNGTTFTDYDLTHSDLCVTITDPDAAFYSEPRSDRLDHSPATLGITD